MSFSSLFYLAICWGCFRLGAFNERHPGELERRGIHAWQRVGKWFK